MAVATVAIKTSSLRARARIEGLVLEIKAKGIELAHRQRALQQATTPAALSARLQAVLVGTGPE
jgi:hypothetical protein